MLCRLCFAIIVLCLASPLSRTYTSAGSLARGGEHSRRARTRALAYRGARIERLKLIRVYGRRIKPRHRVSREDRQLMRRHRCFTLLTVIAFAESLFQYSCLAKSRRFRVFSERLLSSPRALQLFARNAESNYIIYLYVSVLIKFMNLSKIKFTRCARV